MPEKGSFEMGQALEGVHGLKEPQDRTAPLGAKVTFLKIICVNGSFGSTSMCVFPAPEGQKHEFKASLIYKWRPFL